MSISIRRALPGNSRRTAWPWLLVAAYATLPLAGHAAEPLALQGIMKEMGKQMQVIADGLSREDYARVEKAALFIASHPQPPASEKARVIGFMGSNMGRFKSFDNTTHASATALANAAKSGDGEATIAAVHKLQSSCLACHQAFRQPFQEHFYGKVEARPGAD